MSQDLQNQIQISFDKDDEVAFAQILKKNTPSNLDFWFDEIFNQQKTKMLKVLIEYTLSIPGWNSKMNNMLSNCFRDACEHGLVDSLEVLLYYCQSRETREQGLRLAAEGNQPKVVERLLNAKVNANAYQAAAIKSAAYQGHIEVLNLLIPHSNLNTFGRDKRTILETAVISNQLEIVRILAPLCDATLNHSRALKKAITGRKPEMVEIIYPYSNIDDIILKFSLDSFQELKNFKNILNDSLYEKVDPITYHSGFDRFGALSPPEVQQWILEHLDIAYLPELAKIQLNKVIPTGGNHKNQARI